jgi:ADP-ribose pyrophosphatase YjhB (NUDIX family)
VFCKVNDQYKFLVQKRGPHASFPSKLFFPGGAKERYEYTIEACKRELSEEASMHDINIDYLEFAGWIESFDPRYPSRVCYMLEMPYPVSVHPSKSHESEVDMTWLSNYGCKGHAWLTYDQIDITQYSNDMTKMLAVAYKWSKYCGVDLGLPSFLGDRVIGTVHPDNTCEAFDTADIKGWDSFEQYDVVQSDARTSRSWRRSV